MTLPRTDPGIEGDLHARDPDQWRRLLARNSIFLVAVALMVVFALTAPLFATPNNLVNVLRQVTVAGVLGIGMTLVILIGGIDLSVGSVLFLSGGVTGVLLAQGVDAPLAVAAGLAAACVVGLVNGLLVEVAGISPVIVTLGTLIGVRGIAQVLMDNRQIRVTDEGFNQLAFTQLPGIPSLGLPDIPLTVGIMLAAYLIVAVMMRTTRYGRMVYAIGGNPRAARLSGLAVTSTKTVTYVLCSLAAGVGGILAIASTGVIGPNLGAGIEFYVIAAVVLGGTRLSGGIGRVEKTFFGALILYMILNYMTIRHVPTAWQQAATGLILLGAIVFERIVDRETRE